MFCPKTSATMIKPRHVVRASDWLKRQGFKQRFHMQSSKNPGSRGEKTSHAKKNVITDLDFGNLTCEGVNCCS